MRVLMLICDLDIRVLAEDTGELPRALTLDATATTSGQDHIAATWRAPAVTRRARRHVHQPGQALTRAARPANDDPTQVRTMSRDITVRARRDSNP